MPKQFSSRVGIVRWMVLSLSVAILVLCLGCETTAWYKVQSSDDAWEYKDFIKNYPNSPHISEAIAKIAKKEYDDALIFATSHEPDYETKVAFLEKYPNSEAAAAIRTDLITMVRIKVECPSIINSSGSSEEPVWNFTIIFHELNGIGAKIVCTSIRSSNWFHPNPPQGNARLQPKGIATYSSWFSGKKLRGDNVSVSFQITDDNGHSFSKTAMFCLK